MTGGSKASRYEWNISESNATDGSGGAVSWFMPLDASSRGEDVSISTRKVDESGIPFIDDLLDLDDNLPQSSSGRSPAVSRKIMRKD
jgi:hypothetical protein